jgi:hypothetical protein
MGLTWDVPARSSTTHRDDRRQRLRYLASAAVHFRWRSADGHWYDGVGTTRDIGEDGRFVESDSVPPVGSALKLTATVPTSWNCGATVRLTDFGCVRHVRLEPNQTRGFGASVVFHVETPTSKI